MSAHRSRSKRSNLQCRNVVDAHCLGCIKGLAVGRADQRTVMCRLMTDDLIQWLAVRKDFARLNGFVELRGIALHGLEFLLEGIGDVDDESRLDVIFAIRHAVDDLARSPHWNL